MILLGLLSWTCVAQPNTLPKVDQMPGAKSEFVDNPKFGKDPFFPKSDRRGAVIDTPVVVEPTIQASNLALKGISVSAQRRLAIINNRTFEAGEEADLRVANQVLKVRCVEIREKSVLISVNGVSRELFLGQRL